MNYNYLEAVKSDVLDYINNYIDLEDYYDRYNNLNKDELIDYLFETLWTEDSVTGNASGSYTFNTYDAEEYLYHNTELINEVESEFGKLDRDNPEVTDVAIRCYLLNQAICNVVNNL